ncbi:MAG: glutamate--tRNA ligase [Candidatus Puniceispirillaceae bacterium]
MTSLPKVRFAPSPTGKLHVGNLRTALVNFLYAKAHGGQFMLRIDDTDTERSTSEYEEAIRKDLMWMGMQWDCDDRQSDRIDRYDAALAYLIETNRAYACYETAEELALKRKAQLNAGRPPVYDRAALKLDDKQIAAFEAEGRKPHYRFRLLDEEVRWTDLVRGEAVYHMSSLSDPVIIREDGRYIYTLASVVDDIDHHITTILRGEDHVTNSAAQIQLFEALGAKAPQMGHLALLAGADGEGLSKRLGSLSVEELRSNGMLSIAIASLLSRIGTSQPVAAFSSMTEVVNGFDITTYGRATAKFDSTELQMLNGKIIQSVPFTDVQAELNQYGIDDESFWMAVRGNLSVISEAKIWWDICHQNLQTVIEDEVVCKAAISCLPEGKITSDIWKDWTRAISDMTGAKGRALFMPLRLALTGRDAGPEVAGLLPFLGRERIIGRLSGETS